ESSQSASSRELFEELGIKYDFSKSYPNISVNTGFRIDDVFIISNKNIDLNKLKLQKEEVSDAKFVSLNELIKIIDEKEFVPYQKDYINLLFYLRNNSNLFVND
ncbi:MAG: DNA mismatch repair protein MutT, partial [Anaerococcus obesiensis]